MKNVAPTKTNLIASREELKFAHLGYELLDSKRNILVVELLHLVDQTVELQQEAEHDLAKAFSALQDSVLFLGHLSVLRMGRAVNLKTRMSITSRKVMGVELPVVKTEFEGTGPHFSPLDSSVRIDRAMVSFQKALKQMGRLAEMKISVMRLAREVRRTIRKVNALEKIAIPDLEETVKHIYGRLEEAERDMFTLMKMTKQRLESEDNRKNEKERAAHGSPA